MPEADVFTKNYISQNEIFADVFNFFIYGGEQIIRPESLKDENTEASAILLFGSAKGGKKTESTQRYRDVFKSLAVKRDGNTAYVLLGVENQSKINSAMAVRVMIYDALSYGKQIENIAAKHKQNEDKMTSSEFLSGFTKSDRLVPVITLVIYFGAEKWDAPTSLYDMFGQKTERKYDARLMKFVQDYKINLIQPAALTDEELKKFVTDFKQVMKFLKYSNDKVKMRKLLNEDSSYENISTQAALVLKSCANIGIKNQQKRGENKHVQSNPRTARRSSRESVQSNPRIATRSCRRSCQKRARKATRSDSGRGKIFDEELKLVG